MKPPSNPKVKISEITGPYQLFGLVLLVVEGLLGYWFFQAGSGLERGFVGLVMVAIVFGVFYTVIKIKHEDATVSLSNAPISIKPPVREASQAEIASPAAEVMTGPDRFYLINQPPQGWTVQEMTFSDWVSEAIGIKDPATKKKLFPSTDQSREILVFDREKRTSIIPIPGRTMVDGRRIPTALETLVPTQLSIIPIDRAQPPFFIERSLEHNFLMFAGQALSAGALGVTHLDKGVITATGRSYLTVELQQKVQDAIVNGKEGQDVTVTTTVIGIEGELRDHLLMMKHSAVAGDAEAEENLKTLQGLVASFRPLKVVNPEAKRREMAELAEANFKKLMADSGEAIFFAEIKTLLLQWQGIDLEDPEMRTRAMKLLQPFEAMAEGINFHDAELDEFWNALHKAQSGDATDFKANLNELIKEAASEEKEKEAEEAAQLPAAQTNAGAPAGGATDEAAQP